MARISEEAYMSEIKGDLISREALKEAVFLHYYNHVKEISFKVFELIDNAPTVEPDRPQGKWIDHSLENLLWGHNECPFCHKRSNRGAHFCQYCGARLEEAEKDA